MWVHRKEALVWVSICFPWGWGSWPRGPLPPKPLHDFIPHCACFLLQIFQQVFKIQPWHLLSSAHISSLQHATQGTLCPVNRDKSCLWSMMKRWSEVSVPFVTCITHRPDWPARHKEKIPERQNREKCQILALKPAVLEMRFAGFYTEQGYWVGLSPGLSIPCLRNRLNF